MPYDAEKNAFLNKIVNKNGLIFCGHELVRVLTTAIELSESKKEELESLPK